MLWLKRLKWKIANALGLDSHDVGLGSQRVRMYFPIGTVREQTYVPFDLVLKKN